MQWLLTAVLALTCVLPTALSETIAQNDFRFISYHGELIPLIRFSVATLHDVDCDRNLSRRAFIVHSNLR